MQETNNQPNQNEKDSLENLLNQPTENKMFSMPDDDLGEENNNTKSDDLGKAPEKKETIEAPAPKKKFTFDVEKTAEMAVDFVDGIQQAGFTLAYSLACFTKEDRQAIRALKRLYNEKGGSKREITLTDNDLRIMDDYTDFEEYTKDVLPFSDKEKESLTQALAGVLEEANFNPSPKKALIIGGFMITIPRALPILYKFINKTVA